MVSQGREARGGDGRDGKGREEDGKEVQGGGGRRREFSLLRDLFLLAVFFFPALVISEYEVGSRRRAHIIIFTSASIGFIWGNYSQ